MLSRASLLIIYVGMDGMERSVFYETIIEPIHAFQSDLFRRIQRTQRPRAWITPESSSHYARRSKISNPN